MSIAALLLFVRMLGLTVPLWIVAGWSAAEAVLWFIVADVPISWIAVRSGTRAGMLAALVSAVASYVGVVAISLWVRNDPAGAAAAMAALPGIDAAMAGEAADRYRHGYHAVLAGSFSGIPFKLFALEAAKESGWGWFLLLAPLLRLPRFLAVAVLTGSVSHLLERRMTTRQRLALLSVAWVLFYAFYFAVMPR